MRGAAGGTIFCVLTFAGTGASTLFFGLELPPFPLAKAETAASLPDSTR